MRTFKKIVFLVNNSFKFNRVRVLRTVLHLSKEGHLTDIVAYPAKGYPYREKIESDNISVRRIILYSFAFFQSPVFIWIKKKINFLKYLQILGLDRVLL